MVNSRLVTPHQRHHLEYQTNSDLNSSTSRRKDYQQAVPERGPVCGRHVEPGAQILGINGPAALARQKSYLISFALFVF